MGSLLIITGPPGAGKSTVARQLAAGFDSSVLVEGDAFFGFLASGAIAPWLPESNVQNEIVTEAAAAATGRFARGDYTTVYDGIVGPWFLPAFGRATGLTTLDYAILMPSLDRCIAGVRHRVDHGFTDEDATRKVYDEFSSASIDDRHVLRDPPDGVDAVADLIRAELDHGRFAHQVT